MSTQPIVILKLGSSVLRDAAHCAGAVHEIYRHVRAGERVVAVVSALEGETQRLLGAAAAVDAEPDPHLYAELLGLGEQASTLLLAMALDRAGVPAARLGPAELTLRASGDPRNADPASIDAAALRHALQEHAVAIVPGFVALDAGGRPVLLGRGGSDLTALFIAAALGNARCRLLKDVDGIYETDPARSEAPPRRYATLPWAEAQRVAGKLVQPKAIEYAAAQRLDFEVAALAAGQGTRVGACPVRFAAAAAPSRRLRVALFGAGTVGYGVYQLLARQPERFEVVGVAVHDLAKARPGDLPRALLCDDPFELLQRPSDVVVELIGGESPALELMAHALESGRDVVTANKPVVAEHGDLLEELATRNGRRLAFSASVGGSLPCVELVRLAATRGPLRRVEGVLNGTCNFILDQVAAGAPFANALGEAQRRGFAEADPSQDVSGQDAASKLRILARLAFGKDPGRHGIRCTGIEDLPPHAAAGSKDDARAPGRVTRLVASCRRDGEGLLAEVAPLQLAPSHPLAGVRGEWNHLRLELADGSTLEASGKGAGRWPTAEAVVADLVDLWRAAAAAGDRVVEQGAEKTQSRRLAAAG